MQTPGGLGRDPPEAPFVDNGTVTDTVTPAQRFRWYANFVNLSTPLGLAIARMGKARVRPGPAGLVLAEGYRLRFPIAGAFTVGNVIITGSDFELLQRAHPDILDHESRHAWQWLVCLGLPFLPLYVLAMAWSWARTGDRAARNVFERAAGLASGGYRTDLPPREFRRPVRRAPSRPEQSAEQ